MNLLTKSIKTVRLSLRYLVDRYPQFEPPIDRIWNTYEQILFKGYSSINIYNDHNSASLNPYMLIRIDPELVTAQSGGGFHFLKDTGKVKDGAWDQVTNKIKEGYRYRSFREHFQNGVPWEETDFYRKKVEKLSGDERIRSKYVTKEGLDRKCEELDRLYEAMKTEGYKTQKELRKENQLGDYLGDGGRGLLSEDETTLARHEISVDIARDGEPLLNEGRHRLCIAKLLDIQKIPVRVVVRHQKWQNLRNEIANFLETECTATSRKDAIEEVEIYVSQELNREPIMGIEHPDLLSVFDNHFDE